MQMIANTLLAYHFALIYFNSVSRIKLDRHGESTVKTLCYPLSAQYLRYSVLSILLPERCNKK